MNIFEKIIKVIQKSPYKVTPQREKIVEILIENKDKHLSAEELYFILKEKTPDIGIATVYRTLDIFYDLKILEKISFNNGVSKYHLRQANNEELHHHLICTECNVIEKVSNPIFNKLIEYMKKEYEFEVQDNSLSFYGICKKCKDKKGAK
ncbi:MULTISPECIES: Fur family transcriptional regulator [Gemella]|uniref:Fur family transcriptional regulator n=1 Tax=Gemella TaxID=1378 RepID=UPI0007681C50|nr:MULTISPECIES: Fur family transcriptional regulator [Gemella]AME09010.1 Fur family transcriptional regulator [Gemella sp. oral taxon 928]AXI26581.1 transcriptional repressor [Gemella sp. ND 6198]